ncbi:hypothetical protein FACS189487_00930 [Campylobacterota bacterium]|nr:hypothetical protein FACS189487_00930 [Campylobacterota bacterium]
MAQRSDWLPTTREGILAMAREWQIVMTAKQTEWNIPYTATQELTTLTTAAETALSTAQNEATRTPVATAQCRDAFGALTAFMRDSKRRFFLAPPLTNPDFVSLGLKPHDSTPTHSGTPTAQVTVETYLLGRHELGVKFIYVTGNPADLANKGFRIWYSVVAHGETPPASPDDLRKSFLTKRKKDVLEFEFGESGKTAWFAVQIENEGKKGPWGPLVSALIP